MLAFLFLSYGDIQNIHVWKEYLKDAQGYKLYLHRADGISKSDIECSIVKTVPTEWGKFSIVEAQQVLINAALDDGADHLVFVSGDSIPVRPFQELKKSLSDVSWFKWYQPEPRNIKNDPVQNHYERTFTVNNAAIKEDWNWSWTHASQWSILCKSDAEHLRTHYDVLSNIFKQSAVPDEHAYITLLRAMDIKVRNKTHMYVQWTRTLGLCKHAHVSPCTFHEVDFFRGLMEARKEHFFMRKICYTVCVPSNVWK